jgi:hypothetical protein
MDGKYSNLDPKTQKLLEDVQKRNPANLQLQELKSVSDKIGKVLDVLQSKVTKDERSTGDLAELLFEIRDGIDALGNMETPEAPEMPDYASPVVDAVSKLEKALSASIKAIEVNPKVDVVSPTVNVDAPKIDFKGIEKVLKTDIPKAFEKAIKSMPEDTPQDYTPLIAKFDEMALLLESIDTASRMKPQMPNTLKVTNPDGSLIGGLIPNIDYDFVDVQQTNSTTETYVFKTGGSSGTTVQTIVLVYTDSTKANINTVTWS